MSELTFRNLQADDLSKIANLDKDIFPDFWTETMWRSEYERGDFFGFVATMDEDITGYICGTALFEEGELPKVAVKKEYRGLGIGSKLVDCLLKHMQGKGVEKVFLEVRVSNVAALALYTMKGFEKLRERKKYYPDGEDALELFKNL